MPAKGPPKLVELPPCPPDAAMPVREAIAGRRSVRSYVDRAMPLEVLAGIVWAGQGVTSTDNLRAAPSAGALYPLSIHVVAGRVDGLPAGVWRYSPERHALELRGAGDRRAELAHAALRQHWLDNCAAVLILVACCERTVHKYGRRGERYVDQEVGFAAGNAWLMARALGLDAAVVGAFVDADVGALIGLAADEVPLLLLAVGTGSGDAQGDRPLVA